MRNPRGPASPAFSDPSPDRFTTLYMLLLLTLLPVVSSDLTTSLTEDSTSQRPRHSTNTAVDSESMYNQSTCTNNTDIDKENSTEQENICINVEDIEDAKSIMEEVKKTVVHEETDIDKTYGNNHRLKEKIENGHSTGSSLNKKIKYDIKEIVEKDNSITNFSKLENSTSDDNSTYDDFISTLYLDTLIVSSDNNENDTHPEVTQGSVLREHEPADAGNITNGVVSEHATYLLNGSLGNLTETSDKGSLDKKGAESKSSIESSPTPHTPRPRYNTTPSLSHRQSLLAGLGRNISGRLVSILGLFELSTRGVARAEGRSELAAARLAVRHVNQNNVLPGYSLQLITNDTKCDPGVGVDRFFHALYTENSRMVMLLGTACSEVTESLAKVVPYWNMVQVSFGSTSPALSDRSEFPLFYRTVAPDSSHNPARIAFIRKFGWDTVTAFSQNEEVYSLAVNELVTELEAANITCAASITFAETDLEEQLQQLKELDTRIIIASFSPELMAKIFCEAYRLGMYGEEYAWIVSGSSLFLPPPPAPCPAHHLTEALDALVLVDAHNGIVGNNVSFAGLTNEMFKDELRSMGVSMSPYAPQTYDAVWSIALALRNSERTWMSIQESYADQANDSFDQFDPGLPYGLGHFDYSRKDMAEEFLIQLGKLKFLGVSRVFLARDQFLSTAQIESEPLLFTRYKVEGVSRTVALYTGGRAVWCQSCAEARWGVRGVPPVARRVLRVRIDAVWAPARVAGATLAAAGILLALAFLAFNLHYSKRRSIKLSSPRLNNMTLIGCILVYASVALLGLDNATLPSFVPFSAMCTGRVYILSAGFSLAFGSMFAKTYRVHRIFISNRSGVCKTKLLQDTQLISLVCALLLIDGLIVTLWAIADPMERHLKNLTIEISATDRSVVYQPQIEVCKSQNTAGWLCALYAYKGLLLLVGVYMAWETRNVKISALNDSKYIGISVYSVVITSASVVVLGTIISERATLAYITITSLILVSTTATLCLLFLPKIISILDKSEDDPVIPSMGLKLECNTRRFVTDETQELHFRTEIQNKVYRREMAALDKEISRLEKLLESNPTSTSSSTVSVALHRKIESSIEETEEARKMSCAEHRTPSITGGLPLLLLSVLPPVIPRASWPSADHTLAPRPHVNFSSQPKLDQRRSQPAIDLYNLCLNRNTEESSGFLSRLRNMFVGSRPTSRKASTMSIADPTGQGIAAALRMHVGMIAGLVPNTNKNSMVVSCNTLNVPQTDFRLRRESYAKSGPIIHIIDEPSTSAQEHRLQMKRKPQKYIAESETRVNFVLPETHGRPSIEHRGSCDRIKGSPRFPHRVSPATSSLSTLDDRRKTSGDVFCISRENFDQPSRRNSHQPFERQSGQSHIVLENRWKSAEDATAHAPSEGT